MINDMRGQIKEMDEELQSTLKTNDQLELALSDKILRIDSINKEVKTLRHQLTDKEKFIKLFVEDLHKVYTELDSNEWRSGIRQMYHTYVTQDSKRKITKEDQERMKELARQRQYMEHSLGILKQKAVRSEERMKSDVQRKVTENSSLIGYLGSNLTYHSSTFRELNLLRRENWDLRNSVTLLENQLKSGALKAAERLKEKEIIEKALPQLAISNSQRSSSR